jgi:hypothetical protein
MIATFYGKRNAASMPIAEYHKAQPALTVENLRFGASIANIVQRRRSLIFEQ